ncbi:hypothetical protein [Reyranella sp.]|uniref:hypothetical protein n=1 Tax=Reyranella sp. TaxID=1929291 RepID=UPI003BABC49B
MSAARPDIVDELRAECLAAHDIVADAANPTEDERQLLDRDVRWRAAREIEALRHAATAEWQPIATAPKDAAPVLLYCPSLKGHVADEIVVGVWRFDANRRSFGFWVSDVGVLDNGFAETGPWIEYHELHPEKWAPLPPRPASG